MKLFNKKHLHGIKSMMKKFEQNVIELKSGQTLYHGTQSLDFIEYLSSYTKDPKYIWFSRTEEQSELHTFGVDCENRRSSLDYLYPCVYKFKTKRPLYLIDLTLIYEKDKKEAFHYYEGTKDRLLDTEEEIDFLIDVSGYTKSRKKFNVNKDRNVIILQAIHHINKYFGTSYDGYYCENDQDEVTLILNNPDDFYRTFDTNNISVKFLDLRSTLLTYALTEEEEEYFEMLEEGGEDTTDMFRDEMLKDIDAVKYSSLLDKIKTYFDVYDDQLCENLVDYEEPGGMVYNPKHQYTIEWYDYNKITRDTTTKELFFIMIYND